MDQAERHQFGEQLTSTRSKDEQRNQVWPSIVLFLGLVGVYIVPVLVNVTLREVFVEVPSADVVPTSLLPVSLLKEGDFYLDEYRGFFQEKWGSNSYFVREVGSHLVSTFQVGATILALPVYIIPVKSGWTDPRDAFATARVAAALITAASAVFFFYAARRLCSVNLAWSLAWVYGLGTSAWSTASQGLWQHTPSLFFQMMALWLLLRARQYPNSIFYVGGLMSCAVISRYLDLIAALIFAAYIWNFYRPYFLKFVLAAVIPTIGLVLYNVFVLGSVLELTYGPGELQGWNTPIWEGVSGLLFSPSRGIFIYSPFFLFLAFVSLRQLWVDKIYLVAAFAIIATTVIAGRYWIWYGGWSYGYRILTDSLPYWCLLLIPALENIKQKWHTLFIALVAFAIAVQAMGLLDYGGRWHIKYDMGGVDTAWLWNVPQSEIVFYAQLFLERFVQ